MAVRLQLYGLASTAAFALTILNAFRQRPNFYSAAVYLSKSSACTMVLWNQAVFQTILLAKVLQKVFFGNLRMIEVERLQERSWFAITETLLALTIFKDEFDSSFIILFITLLFVKVFHWLASDRVEWMEQTASVPRLFHLRMLSLLSILWLADAVLVVFAIECIIVEGASVMIMFASEYLIMAASLWSTSIKYALNAIDQRSEEPWEQKSMYVFYVELVSDFAKLVTYLLFFVLILSFYGLPLNILRDVYLTTRSFILKLRDLRRLKQATRNMDTLYPNVSREELDRLADKTCIICREDMEYRDSPDEEQSADPQQSSAAAAASQRRGPNDTPKKLPCGHMFHFHCLRSWLERQQSCPTCRRSVLESSSQDDMHRQAAEHARQQPQLPQRQDAANRPGDQHEPPPYRAQGPDEPLQDVVARHGMFRVREPTTVQEAQSLIAKALGRPTFEAMFPGVPFPAPTPPMSPALRPQQRSDAVPSTSRASSSSPKPNPLLSFSLPSLPLTRTSASTSKSGTIARGSNATPAAEATNTTTTANGHADPKGKRKQAATDDSEDAIGPDASPLDPALVNGELDTNLSPREAARAAAERRAVSIGRTNAPGVGLGLSSGHSSTTTADGGAQEGRGGGGGATTTRPRLSDLRSSASGAFSTSFIDSTTPSALNSPTRLTARLEERLDASPPSSSHKDRESMDIITSSSSGEGGQGQVGNGDESEREARDQLENRLKKLVAFQERIGSLIDEMKESLD